MRSEEAKRGNLASREILRIRRPEGAEGRRSRQPRAPPPRQRSRGSSQRLRRGGLRLYRRGLQLRLRLRCLAILGSKLERMRSCERVTEGDETKPQPQRTRERLESFYLPPPGKGRSFISPPHLYKITSHPLLLTKIIFTLYLLFIFKNFKTL